MLPYIKEHKRKRKQSEIYINMDRKYNKRLIVNAKYLRKNMTKEERHLWYDFLRGYPIKFVRQKVIGKYIVDFYCARAKLVVEVDGEQHYLTEDAVAKDKERTEYLKEYGIKVLRIQNPEINTNFESVCSYIHNIVRNGTEISN